MAKTFGMIARSALAGLLACSAPAMAAPAHPVNSPSLAETLDFFRSKLAQQGKINFAGAIHDSADNSDWVNQFDVEASNVTADRAACQVNYHWTTHVDGSQKQDMDTGFDFKKVDSIALTSMEQDLDQLSAGEGHPTYTAKVNPPVWVVTASMADGTKHVVDFPDRDLAVRVIHAMNHAMKLCGAKREAF